MTAHTIDLTNITLVEFELIGSIVEPETGTPTPSSKAIELAALLYLGTINGEITALNPAATDPASVTLRRH